MIGPVPNQYFSLNFLPCSHQKLYSEKKSPQQNHPSLKIQPIDTVILNWTKKKKKNKSLLYQSTHTHAHIYPIIHSSVSHKVKYPSTYLPLSSLWETSTRDPLGEEGFSELVAEATVLRIGALVLHLDLEKSRAEARLSTDKFAICRSGFDDVFAYKLLRRCCWWLTARSLLQYTITCSLSLDGPLENCAGDGSWWWSARRISMEKS